jgi:hypothetical protein
VTEVEGVVLLNGSPLPKALVTFMPELDNFGAEMNSTGETDDQGRFTLTCNHKQQPGACVGTHRVLVTDLPVPPELRAAEAQGELAGYLRTLKNRPIPLDCGNYAKTPLRAEVKADQKMYQITLTR